MAEPHNCWDYGEQQVLSDSSYLDQKGRAPAYLICGICDRVLRPIGFDSVM